jgi:hypothetical protein
MILTKEMHEAVKNSHVGQFIDRLIREEVARGGDTKTHWNGNVIEALWAAFMSGRNPSFREIKKGIKDGTSVS